MIIVNFDRNELCKKAYGLWQYDYGQVLRIQGLNLPTAVEMHFSLTETGGEAVTRIGITKDGVTDVTIPDSLLEADGTSQDYQIYVFIYLASLESGETTRKITLEVKSRPRPEAFEAPGDGELFEEAIQAVNDAAKRAEDAGKEATAAAGEAWESASLAGKYLTETQALAEQVEINADAVTQGTETARQLLAQTQEAAIDAVISAQAAKQAETAAREAQTAAETAEDAARQYAEETEADRREVAESKQSIEQIQNDVAKMQADVQADREAVEQVAAGFGTAAENALTAIGQAQNTAVSAVQTEGQKQATAVQEAGTQAVNEVDTAKTAAVGAVTAEGDKQVGRVQDAAAEIVADREQIQQNKADIAALTDETNILAPGIVLGAKGETIAVRNASERPFAGLSVYGKSTQEQTTGVQLFNVADVEMNAILNMDGTTSSNGSINTSGFVKVSPNTKYSVSSTRQNRGKFYDIDKQVLTTDKFDFELSNSGDKFTTPENVEYVRFSIYGTEDLGTLMMNVGETLKPWEPYTGGKPSPSMEYQQEITHAGQNGEVNVHIITGNLFPIDKLEKYEVDDSTKKISLDGNKVIFSGRGNTGKESIAFLLNKKEDKLCLPPGKYTLSFKSDRPHGTTNGENTVEMFLIVERQNGTTNVYSTGSAGTKSINIEVGDKLYFRCDINNDSMSAEFYDIMLSQGNVEPYEPYAEQTLTLATPNGLLGIPVKSGGNYTDENGQQWITDEIDLEKEERVQRIGKHIFGDTDRFSYLYDEKYNLSRFSWLDYIEMAEIDTPVMYGKMRYVGTGATEENVIKGSSGFSRCYMYVNTSINTVEKFKEIIAGSEIIYVLSNPIRTPLSPEEIASYKALHAYSPNTTITNDGSCGMSMEYVADTKTYIQSIEDKITAIQAALINQNISGGG